VNICTKIVEVVLWVILIAALGFLSLSPPQAVIPAVRLAGGAFMGHILGYALLGFSTFLVFGYAIPRLRNSLMLRTGLTVLFCFALGGILELLQPGFGREFRVTDLFANGLGGILGAFLARLLWKSSAGNMVFHQEEKR